MRSLHCAPLSTLPSTHDNTRIFRRLSVLLSIGGTRFMLLSQNGTCDNKAMLQTHERSNGSNRRSGRLVPIDGQEAFVPEPLPPSPPLSLGPDLQVLLSRADRALGRLDGCTEMLPDAELFMVMYIRLEAVLSSQIEGTQASLLDVLEFEAGPSDSPTVGDAFEVVNYVNATNLGLKRVREAPLSLDLIREIHKELMTGVRGGSLSPGAFRREQNWIGAPGTPIGAASFVPPPPSYLQGCLRDFETFLNTDARLPPLVKVGLAHAQFESIHPFLDGNGRLGRLLITFMLCQQGVLQRPLLYLSYYLKEHQAEYYSRLQAVRLEGDWEGWLSFFLVGVAEVADSATRQAQRIVAMREEHRQILTDAMGRGAGSALALLERLFRLPFASVNNVAETTSLSFASANRLVAEMVRLKLLEEQTGQRRNREFLYRPYLDLLRNRSEPAAVHAPELASSAEAS